ncbi:MAG: proteasome accessory factor [Verrucomicrobiota bacterium]|jgi:proteasome accessory factor A
MADRIFGMETEYAFTARAVDGRVLSPGPLVERIERIASRILPSLPGLRSSGMFLQNASRFYRDPAGSYTHLEIAGPECSNPWDAVRYVQAGERQLVELASALLQADSSVADAAFNKTNIDYSGCQTTWGCHESYLTTRGIGAISAQLIPHLVSRIPLTGAGGFNSRSPGIEFLVSPRVAHLTTVENAGSQHDRPIFHTRDEPLCDGYHRLHVICGESLCSEQSAWLKIGTTAVVVAMIDAGLDPGQGVQFVSPLDAIRIFASDPGCRSRALLTDGRTVTALDVQRHFLHLAERHQHAGFMPAFWTEPVCVAWRRLLDRLESGEASVRRTLDWAIKLDLYREHAERRGIAWQSLPIWNEALRRLHHVVPLGVARDGEKPSTGITVPGTRIPITEPVREILGAPPGPGLDWDQLPHLLQLRRELFEIDWRFGELGERSLFTQLDRAGVLAHHQPGVDNIHHAMVHPPNSGRARLRGEVIQRVAHLKDRFNCDWKAIFDVGNGMMLDLGDPFAREERWRAFAQARSSGPDADPELARILAQLV